MIANSPGEVLTWATTLTKWFKVELLLTPCPFASGRELQYAQESGKFSYVVPPWTTFRWALLGKRGGLSFYKGELLLHLGGDLFYSFLLSKRFGLRVVSYIWGNKLFDRAVELYMVYSSSQRETLLRRGISGTKIVKVRDLIWEELRDVVEMGGDPELRAELSLMLGSREREVEFLLPFMLETLRTLAKRYGRLTANLPLSPLISPELVRNLVLNMGVELLSDGSEAVSDNLLIRFIYNRERRYRAILSSELVVSIPGTKTHEVAYLGKPMLVILPMHKPEEIPVGGLPGLLDFLPFGIGRRLKGALVRRMEKRFGYVALPNILAGKRIVPELRGAFTPEELADEVSRLLDSEPSRKSIVERLSETYEEFKRGEPVPSLLLSLKNE